MILYCLSIDPRFFKSYLFSSLFWITFYVFLYFYQLLNYTFHRLLSNLIKNLIFIQTNLGLDTHKWVYCVIWYVRLLTATLNWCALHSPFITTHFTAPNDILKGSVIFMLSCNFQVLQSPLLYFWCKRFLNSLYVWNNYLTRSSGVAKITQCLIRDQPSRIFKMHIKKQ